MAIKGFDYKGFAKSIAEQAKGLAPEDLTDYAKEYLIKTLENFTFLTGEALYKDRSLKLNAEQAVLLTQIVSEWTFHKCVDLARSGIDSKYWDGVMQKVAFTVFEVAKQAVLKKLPQEQIVQVAEYHVVKAYNEAIDELYNDKKITEEIVEMAKSQSNIDKIAEEESGDETEGKEESLEESDYDDFEVEEIEEKNSSSIVCFKDNVIILTLLIILMAFGVKLYFLKPSEELLKYIVLVLYLFPVFAILTKKYNKIALIFGQSLILVCTIFMLIFHYSHACCFLVSFLAFTYYLYKEYAKEKIQAWENIKDGIENYVTNPDVMYLQLGVDVISILVGNKLIPIIDSNYYGPLISNQLMGLRQKLTDNYGYIIPSVVVSDSEELEEYEYNILIRNNVIASGYVYPGKEMVFADEWDKQFGYVPEGSIIGIDPTSKSQVYWVNYDIVIKNMDKVTFVAPGDVIMTHLGECAIKHVDDILTDLDASKYIKLEFDNDLLMVDRWNYLKQALNVYDIRKILVNLIKEKVSVKDACFIRAKICEFLKDSCEPDVLSERLRIALKRQICSQHLDEHGVLHVISTSNQWCQIFENNLAEIKQGAVMIGESSSDINALIESVAVSLMKANQEFGRQPVVVVPSHIRKYVYEFLVTQISTVVVLSKAELISGIKIVDCGIIE